MILHPNPMFFDFRQKLFPEKLLAEKFFSEK
jgi:hypothetical protein